jgi:hypothetical protein
MIRYVAGVIRRLRPAYHRAVWRLRPSKLGDAYELAWQEWEQSGDAELWEPTVADGLPLRKHWQNRVPVS